jgi:GNAT superfamily N-acetyltransferase
VRETDGVPVEITQAVPDRVPVLASVLGRAFVDEPMLRWPLGEHGDLAERFRLSFLYFLEGLVPFGLLWEAEPALGGTVWIPSDQAGAWADAQMGDPRIVALAADERRYTAFWEWIDGKLPDEPVWHLDTIGVAPKAQGIGIGAALMEHGLARAHAEGASVFLETGTLRNVPWYERFGFRTVEDEDAPDGGPHIWFMRWDP